MVRGSKMWLSQRKLAIFAAISECFSYAEAKYCAFEIHGEPKYYVCPRTEYCCNFGCCVSPGFQIYHLWYYWLLVIIMFLVCSGGGWWYRYWLQGRYRPSASAVPPRTSSTRTQSTLRGPTCRAQQARVTYNPARNTVLLHRMWKGPQRNATPPAYNGAAASSAQFQDTNVVLNENNCPYYELYGPPPSYETVIAQTRGKIRSPTPVDHQSRNNNVQVGGLEHQNIAHCFTHNYTSLPTSERRNSCGSNSEESDNYLMNFGCKNFAQKRTAAQSTLRLGANTATSESVASGTRAQNNVYRKLLPLCLTETEAEQSGERATLRYSESSPDMFESVDARGNVNGMPECASSLESTQNVVVSGLSNNRGMVSSEGAKEARDLVSQSESIVEMMMMDSEEPAAARENDIDVEIRESRIPKMFTYAKSDVFGNKYRRWASNSLRGRTGEEGSAKWGESRDSYCDVHRHKESGEREKRTDNEEELACGKFEFDSAEAEETNRSRSKIIGLECEECVTDNGVSNSEELNPSNIVILPSHNNSNVQINSLPQTINIIENYQHYPPTTSSPAQLRSTTLSTNIESENKLGRSKSLD